MHLRHEVKGITWHRFRLRQDESGYQAFVLLDGDALEGTELYRRYHLELSELPVPAWHDFWGATGSFWRPMAGLGRVGNHFGTGVFAGRQWPHWVSRADISLRLGRAAEPYLVKTSNFIGMSDRYGGLSLMLETGPSLWRSGRARIDLLAGGSVETLTPFKDEKDIVLTTFHGNLGAGLHVDLGQDKAWFMELDWRREWVLALSFLMIAKTVMT